MPDPTTPPTPPPGLGAMPGAPTDRVGQAFTLALLAAQSCDAPNGPCKACGYLVSVTQALEGDFANPAEPANPPA